MRNSELWLKRLLILCFVLLLVIPLVFGQRPKVGLTLSGGGAKGLAHIGILKAIDSAGLKVDYLTGTSMGAVVGSLYAAGYSGKDIEHIVRGIDWNTMFKNNPNFDDVALREKDEFASYLLEVPLKGFKPAPSSGLIDPEAIWIEFSKVLYPVYKVKDFHQLSIPFECLATDLETGKPVVLSTGELVPAIRSSMAIPSVFTPVIYQGKMLVDGGLVKNFPVAQNKKMGADYLIGVSLYAGLMDRTQITSALNVMDQITSYVDAEDEVKAKAMCDMLIMPPMGSYTAASFDEYEEILKIGDEEGRRLYPQFKRLADSLNRIAPQEYNPYTRLKEEASVTIDSIEVVGIKETTQKQLLDNMAISVGRSYSPRRLSEALKRAYASLEYKYIYYELYPTSKLNHAKIKIIAEEYSSSWIKLGLLYNSFLGTVVNLNYTLRNYRSSNSRTLFKISLGDSFDALVQGRLVYGEKNRNQLQSEARVTDLKMPIYNGNRKLYVYSTTFNRIDLSYRRYLGNNSGLGAGLALDYTSYSPDIASDIRYRGGELHLYGYVEQTSNTLDRKVFPTSGAVSNFEAGIVFGRSMQRKVSQSLSVYDSLLLSIKARPYYRLLYQGLGFKPISPKVSLIGQLQLGAQLKFEGLYFDEFWIGGEESLFHQHISFTGLKDAQLVTSSFGAVLVGIQTNIFDNLYVQGKVNFCSYNFIDNQTLFSAGGTSYIWGGGVSLGYFISKWPIRLSFSYSPEMHKLYSSFSIGYAF